MSCEVKLNTLQGGVITLDLPMTTTVLELKAMLLEKHPCRDPSKRKVLKVELLRNTSIIDETETLGSGGFLSAESQVSVAYTTNEVEAATKHDIHTCGSFGVTIPSNVTDISREAFLNSQQLVLLTMPESVRTIGDSAFAHCISLESITFGESVTHICDDAFLYCTSLESITLGESVTHIGSGAFADCTSLKGITLGESVTHIGSGAFANCTSLESITLGEAVTHIGSCAFANCTSLKGITLGESVTHIGSCAFANCTSWKGITFGESVTHIGSGAFVHCRCLESITLGESVTHIGSGAFASCTSLKGITLGESVTHIGRHAFDNCRSLKSIRFPESLRHILERELGVSTMARIAIPAKQGRKRLRQEWVNDRTVMPMTGATCRTLMNIVCMCFPMSHKPCDEFWVVCALQSHAHNLCKSIYLYIVSIIYIYIHRMIIPFHYRMGCVNLGTGLSFPCRKKYCLEYMFAPFGGVGDITVARWWQ